MMLKFCLHVATLSKRLEASLLRIAVFFFLNSCFPRFLVVAVMRSVEFYVRIKLHDLETKEDCCFFFPSVFWLFQ
jgi:hypothetical protein